MITGDMTVLHIIEKYPETRRVFDAYGERYGICITCASLFRPLWEVAAAYGIPLEGLVADLEKAVNGS